MVETNRLRATVDTIRRRRRPLREIAAVLDLHDPADTINRTLPGVAAARVACELNHHPIIGGIRLCGARDGTATRFGSPVTCPACVAKLAYKMATEANNSVKSKSAQERRFYAAGAARLARVITGTDQVSA